MTIWIDADACPRDVKEVVFRAAGRTNTMVVLVANKPLGTPATPLVRSVQVPGGPDVADDHIVNESAVDDIAVTADIPLAARLVEKGVVAIDPRGVLFDEDNIGERLSIRDFASDVRDIGLVTGGPKPYTAKDKQRFAAALDAALHRYRQRHPSV